MEYIERIKLNVPKVSGRIRIRPVVGGDGTAHGEESSFPRSSLGVQEGYNPLVRARNRERRSREASASAECHRQKLVGVGVK